MSAAPAANDAVIEGLARVVRVEHSQAWLQALPPAGCGSCATRHACAGASARSATQHWAVPLLPGVGQATLVVGDTVRVGVDRSTLTRASLTAYALPLVTLLASVLALQDAPDTLAAAGALAGLLVGVAIARRLARRWQTALLPQVLGRAQLTSAPSCTASTPATMAASHSTQTLNRSR